MQALQCEVYIKGKQPASRRCSNCGYDGDIVPQIEVRHRQGLRDAVRNSHRQERGQQRLACRAVRGQLENGLALQAEGTGGHGEQRAIPVGGRGLRGRIRDRGTGARHAGKEQER